MWHEARRQEKLMKARIVDSSRRAERRRRFYDNVRKEPDQFMQLHGRKCIIHTDKNIAKAAEESSILRKWQGDPSILIDRFDARSHLDFIPEVKKKDFIPDSEDEKQEIVCDFERFRVLIINEYRNVSEQTYLQKIAEKEFWRVSGDDEKRQELDKKRKSMDSKASIGFTYDNSEIVVRDSDVEDSEDEGEMEEPEEIDVDLDLTCVDAEAQRRANKLGEEYGVRRGTFAGLMRADQQARLETAELRRIDRQKALLAGRESKHERALLKKQRAMIVGKGCQDEATTTLLSFVENANKGKKSLLDESSSSESSDEEPAKAQFITTFGGDDEKDEEDEEEKPKKQPVLGPQLPTKEYRRIFNLTKRGDSPELTVRGEKGRSPSRPRDRRRRSWSNSPRHRRSRSRDRRRSRSRSNGRRRSHSRSRDRYRRRSHSRSHEHERRGHRRSWSRSRERDNKHIRSSPGTSDRPLFRSDRRESGRHDDRKILHSHKHESPGSKSQESNDGGDMLEIRSSMSESEKERIQIENRKRRINRTKRMVRENKVTITKAPDVDSEEEEKKEIARKIKLKMKKALRQTVEEFREGEEEKKREAEKERKIRDEIMYIEEQERRERERERRRERRRKEEELSGKDRRRRRRSRSRSCDSDRPNKDYRERR